MQLFHVTVMCMQLFHVTVMCVQLFHVTVMCVQLFHVLHCTHSSQQLELLLYFIGDSELTMP